MSDTTRPGGLADTGFWAKGIDPAAAPAQGVVREGSPVERHAWFVFGPRNATRGARHGRAKVVRL